MDKRHTECMLAEMMRWLGTNSPLKKSYLQQGNLDTHISSKIFWESWSLLLHIHQRWYKQQPCTLIYSKPKEFEVQKISSKVPDETETRLTHGRSAKSTNGEDSLTVYDLIWFAVQTKTTKKEVLTFCPRAVTCLTTIMPPWLQESP